MQGRNTEAGSSRRVQVGAGHNHAPDLTETSGDEADEVLIGIRGHESSNLADLVIGGQAVKVFVVVDWGL